MKIGVIGDVHWSKYSSIMRLRGHKYSKRLENCIESINWAEQKLKEEHVDLIVYLGDFFDKSLLDAEEITALNELNFCNAPHMLLVGNHEMGINDLSISSSHLFNLNNFEVIEKITRVENMLFIPYILNDNTDYDSYLEKADIIFSHNDLKDIQMGKFKSTQGFSIEAIQENCRLFINGHLHNGMEVAKNVINLGNLTGQNFSEDAEKYSHEIMTIDTATNIIETFENPHALNFYKINNTDVKLKNNAVVMASCKESEYSRMKEFLDNNSNVITSRIIVTPDTKEETETSNKEIFTLDYLQKFNDFVTTELGSNDIITTEINEVLR